MCASKVALESRALRNEGGKAGFSAPAATEADIFVPGENCKFSPRSVSISFPSPFSRSFSPPCERGRNSTLMQVSIAFVDGIRPSLLCRGSPCLGPSPFPKPGPRNHCRSGSGFVGTKKMSKNARRADFPGLTIPFGRPWDVDGGGEVETPGERGKILCG